MALKSIWGNKMRSFLTMLGIIIGVASVIILVSIVNGYMSYMVESFSSMGVNQITVQYKAVASRSIDVDEFYEFYEERSDLYENMSPNVSVSVTVKHDSDAMDSTSVGGYSEDYLAIKDYEISSTPTWRRDEKSRSSALMWRRNSTAAPRTPWARRSS